ncbi:helix-turn-helix domain-containing protein [Runella slithyformis]|uniref:Transcriptional regulator, AraC family n=1 Tax=Runella slithyformis (strain ATCC 29530 / DSM 19594 / LMG 11500 / NCIMB 11436 / LSU 4) TaxID=761193 RepID=A0A7U3ZHT1_RUNSL|nr:AraC family transcriptional regulator [Runella slithyformis]AEI47435.1 transcriptional regulator, AraC family [Runella slithyformis DSM 19594]
MNKFAFKSTFSLLNADHVQLNKSWNYKDIISPFYRLYLISEGHGTLCNAAQSIALESGYLYLIPSFTSCSYVCPEQLTQYYLHILEDSSDAASLFIANRKIIKVPAFPGDFIHFKRLLELNPERGLLKSENPEDYEKQPVIQEFQQLNNRLSLSAYVETQGIILQLISRFLDTAYFQPEPINTIPFKIAESIRYIQTHLHTNLTVEQLAEKAHQSPDYFSGIFKKNTGERPLAYIQLKRIERAQFLMITSDLTLTEIATETGFESLAYFSRMFKKVTGQPPSVYRKNNRRV